MMQGIPSGYEFVRVGRAEKGETVVGSTGMPYILGSKGISLNSVVIRKKPEICTYPKGLFNDGWLTYDKLKGNCWWAQQPDWNDADQQWTANVYCISIIFEDHRAFRQRIVWRGDNEDRIVQVGPSVE
ncbi:MAG: hypothetical protein E6Q97_20745 [Desulfurellales bacterium]|nr:MAG: hypothetical protein E6Q97_20745 [Desulfurellales bacterium]